MDFYKRMKLVCDRIPYGKVATYGQIALLCGCPANARQVGFGLRTDRAGDVPAHRIVNAAGILSGAGAFEHLLMQKRMLEEEGVAVIECNSGWQVDLKKYRWENTLSEAEELRRSFAAERI